MKKIKYIFLFLCFVFNANSQINLIPNPGFEQDTACPDQTGQIYKLKDWYRVNATPDYFNRCYYGVNNNASVPKNVFGYQNINNLCSSYVGIYPYTHLINSTNSEIIGVKLNSQLASATKYYFSMKVSLANTSKKACNNIGVQFYNSQPAYTFTIAPTNSAHITFTETVTDTLNWIRLFKSFTPNLNFEYVSIGNFYDTVSFNRVFLYNELSPHIYYYIDDVCLGTDSAFVYNYTFNCLTNSLNEFTIDNFKIYPNPAIDKITLENCEYTKVELLNLNGSILMQYRREEEITFSLPHGMYILRVEINDKHYHFKFFINP